MKSGLHFVFSNIDIRADLPFSLSGKETIRKASLNEALIIQKTIDDQLGAVRRACVYRNDLSIVDKGGGNSEYVYTLLPPERWRYWVIAYEGNDNNPYWLNLASSLIPHDFELGIGVYYTGEAQSGVAFCISEPAAYLIEKYKSYDGDMVGSPKVLGIDELIQLREILSLIVRMPESADFVRQGLGNLGSLRDLPKESSLRVVGYFSVIEALVTHPPRLTETLDSITHQIINKMILLRKQFGRDIAYDSYFKPCAEDKIWKTLYKYRSSLAHGGACDFNGELQLLVSHRKVLSFLKEIVKELLVFGLRNHVFLADLKKC